MALDRAEQSSDRRTDDPTAAGAALGVDPQLERSLGRLVADASEDVSALLRSEIALAKAELKADATNAAAGAGLFAGAGYLLILTSVVLVISAAYGLTETGLPAWAAFLIVAVVLILLAGLLALLGRSRITRVGPPERTIRTTKDTLAAVKHGGR